MNAVPCSHRYLLLPLPFVFCLLLAGCGGGSGGSGLLDKSSANVSVSASSASLTQGQSVTLEAYVNPTLATGTVTFYNGSTAIGTAQLNDAVGFTTTGIALLATSFNSIGAQSITARYSGNDFYSAGTSAPMTIGVYSDNLAPTSVSLQASTTTPAYQTNVTLTATVSPSAATGSVTFYNGSTNIGSAAVSGGVATTTTSFAAGGAATLHAVYSGDYNYLSSTTNSLTMNVSGPLATSITLRASASTAAISGIPITLTATLSPASATGTVTFYVESTPIGTTNVSAGVATLNWSFVISGNEVLKATFAANSSWESSTSNQVNVFVTGNFPDTVALQVAPSSVVIGYSAQLTANITPAAATGTVTFYDGTVALGNTTVAAGTATMTNTFMSPGAQSLTAVYSGDFYYLSSTSSPATLNVSNPGPTPTATALTLSEYSGYDGDSVTLTAVVNPPAATGQVNFYDNGSLLGSAVVSSGTAAWSQVFTSDGGNEITAVYQGDITYSSSTSSAQTLVLSEPPNTTPSCPSDPIDCAIECPGNQNCYTTCPSDPDLCAAECPGYTGCPPDTGDSSTDLRRRTSLDGTIKLRKPLLKLDGFRRKGC